MRKKTVFAAALIICLLTGCSRSEVSDNSGTGTVSSVTQSTEVQPVIADKKAAKQIDLTGLDKTKNGYGQGTNCDDKNRTLGALDFNKEYGKYNSVAIDEKSEKITLTFDQGYENGYTAKILDVLKKKKVKAVFFLLQDYAEKNPELVKRMIKEGHTIGNHSVHHYSMPTLDEAKCKSEIMDMHKYVKDKFGKEMTLFRPPMGEYSKYSLAVTANCGYKTMMWSYAYADWDVDNQPEPKQALKGLVNAAHPGAIYLLHSVSKTNAQVLGDMIDQIRAKGYKFN